MLDIEHFVTEKDVKILENGHLLYLKVIYMKEVEKLSLSSFYQRFEPFLISKKLVARQTGLQTKSLLKLSIISSVQNNPSLFEKMVFFIKLHSTTFESSNSTIWHRREYTSGHRYITLVLYLRVN